MHRQVRYALTLALIALLAASCDPTSTGSSGKARPDSGPVGALLIRTGQFISVRPVPGNRRGLAEISVSSARTGAIIRRLLPASLNGMTVSGLSLARSGDLWITYSAGPVSRGDLAGGDPKPHSCANEIAVLHPGARRLSVLLRTGNNVLIGGAALSPDGRLLAWRESGCATGFLNSYLRISRIATGQTWTIGRGLPRCHVITDPAWALNSLALVVSYAAHAGGRYTGPQGTCGGIGQGRLVELSPVPQAGLTGQVVGAARQCAIDAAAPAAAGELLAIEACGAQQHTLGPAWMLVVDAHLHVLRRILLGRCADGSDLSTAMAGRGVLVSAYLFCNPPGRPGPLTRLWTYGHGQLRLLATVPGGILSVSHMTW